MAAANANRDAQRQPGDLLHFTGASGYKYYKGTLLIKTGASGARVVPLTAAGSSHGYFLGVVENQVDLTAGLGASQAIIDVWATGEFTFKANGTGASSHIGQIAYGLDDQTVGISMAIHSLPVGIITGYPNTSEYRVWINSFVGARGVSHFPNNL